MFEVIEKRLKEMDKTLYWLAKELGITRQRIYQMKKQPNIRLETAFKIADVLEIDINEFRKGG